MLPDVTLGAGERIVLYADDSLGQGERHLPFKLSAQGEALEVWEKGSCQRVDSLRLPALGENEVYARYPDGSGEASICRYASAGLSNGEHCTAERASTPLEDVTFDEYEWPPEFPAAGTPLDVNELTLQYGDRGREAVFRLLGEAGEKGLIPKVAVEFAS